MTFVISFGGLLDLIGLVGLVGLVVAVYRLTEKSPLGGLEWQFGKSEYGI